MISIKTWIKASRPHTLPLAISCAGIGNILAMKQFPSRFGVLALSLLTAIFLQILSNLANDYGDYIHGADSEKRTGPQRTVQSGLISVSQMKKAIIITAVASILSGIGLLLSCLEHVNHLVLIFFFLAGVAAIWATWHYTASKNPYGYHGYGDLFVFIFFGLLSVMGTFVLHSGAFEWYILLPATAYGFFSTAVLNLNNIRDIESDKAAGKLTLAVKLGRSKAIAYHNFLLISGVLMIFIYSFIANFSHSVFWFLLPSAFFIYHLFQVRTASSEKDFYPLLKQLSLVILIFSLVFSFGILFIQ